MNPAYPTCRGACSRFSWLGRQLLACVQVLLPLSLSAAGDSCLEEGVGGWVADGILENFPTLTLPVEQLAWYWAAQAATSLLFPRQLMYSTCRLYVYLGECLANNIDWAYWLIACFKELQRGRFCSVGFARELSWWLGCCCHLSMV